MDKLDKLVIKTKDVDGYKYKNEKLISLKEKKVVKTVLIQAATGLVANAR